MRLFSKVDGVIDKYDNVGWYGDPFDIRFHPEFPELSQGPDVDSFKKHPPEDPTHRTDYMSGAVGTRPTSLAFPRAWEFSILDLTPADESELSYFERVSVRYGGGTFFWENTIDGTEYLVRFGAPIVWRLKTLDKLIPLLRWDADIILVEANPTSG